MPRLASVLGFAILAMLGLAASARADNPYGVMLFPNAGEDFDLALARAHGLGVVWFRPPTIALQRWSATAPCPVCTGHGRADLKLAITVRNTADPHQPSQPPADLAAYGKLIATVVATIRPGLLVVENEENSPAFVAGGADGAKIYVAELTAACASAHEQHVPCANGGLTGEAAAALTWINFLDRDQSERACDFARRALPQEKLCGYHRAADVPPMLRQHLIGSAAALVALYRNAPLDYVNFHWFCPDSRAFAETANYLTQATGKPAITNEFGQRRDAANPDLIRPLLRAARAENMPLAIWYSIDTADTASLFGPDGRLRPTGWEFQRQLSGLR